MPVYPGDPDVVINQIHSIPKEGWSLRTLSLTTHTGTHANAPIHMDVKGKTLNLIPLDRFTGPCVIYHPNTVFNQTTGVFFLALFGFPLNIKEADGSPVRAVALLE